MIVINQLTKVYPSGKGIRNLSFQVDRGEIFGFLGPNGAGKTTTIRVLMGFLRPDNGTAAIKGLNTWQEKTYLKRIIGYLPGELRFFDKLTAEEHLLLLLKMHGNNRHMRQKCRDLIKRFDLDVKQPVSKISKGMKQKLGLISAFMLNTEVFLLDEPTSGLDPLMQKVFLDLIFEEKTKGTTILMSSHQFAEIERTCARVGIIRDGELLAVQDMAQLKQIKRHTFDIRAENEDAAEFLRRSGLQIIAEHGLDLTIAVSGDLDILWKTFAQTQISEFRQRPLELEETFMQFYR